MFNSVGEMPILFAMIASGSLPARSSASRAFRGTPASNCVLRLARYDRSCTSERRLLAAMTRARAVTLVRAVGRDAGFVPPGEPPGAMLDVGDCESGNKTTGFPPPVHSASSPTMV